MIIKKKFLNFTMRHTSRLVKIVLEFKNHCNRRAWNMKNSCTPIIWILYQSIPQVGTKLFDQGQFRGNCQNCNDHHIISSQFPGNKERLQAWFHVPSPLTEIDLLGLSKQLQATVVSFRMAMAFIVFVSYGSSSDVL